MKWHDLLVFESFDLVKEYISQKFNREPNTRKINQVTSNFLQSREYFRSSKDADISVKPLLQYYGVLALSRGIILLSDSSRTEDQLKQAHGLELINWQKNIHKQSFEDISVKITNGTFFELISATNNISYLKCNSSVVNWYIHLEPPELGEVITLKSLLNYLPDFKQEIQLWLNYDLSFGTMSSLKPLEDKKFSIKLNSYQPDEFLTESFPTTKCDQLQITKEKNSTTIEFVDNGWLPNFAQLTGPFLPVGDCVIIPAINQKFGINLLGTLFIYSYIFGMLSRYYPTTWLSLRRSKKGDKIFPFIYKLLDYIPRNFPLYALEYLNAPYPFENN